MCEHIVRVIVIIARASIDADRPSKGVRLIAGVFQSMPAKLQEDALLRVHQPRFRRRNAEERGVKLIGILYDATIGRIVGIVY